MTMAYLQQPRLKIHVDEDVVAVKLEAVFVVNNCLLHRQQRPKNRGDITQEQKVSRDSC